jgi:NAD(P)-dependent dehydrogenase (short-subunit alcohol dehydrogenase family)
VIDIRDKVVVTGGGSGIGAQLCRRFAGEGAAAVVVVDQRGEPAAAVLARLAAGTFLILPHPEVGRFWAQKASDPDRWLAGMRRLLSGKNP